MGLLDDVKSALNGLSALGQMAQQQQHNGSGASGNSPQSNASTQPQNLDESIQVTLDGSGNGKAQITPYGPRMGGSSWEVSNVYVSVATNTNEASGQLFLSRGILSALPFDSQGQSATASSGDTYSNGFTARPGDWITFIWAGGDAGAKATMTLKGTINPQGS